MHQRFMKDLNKRCSQLLDDEIVKENIEKIITDLAYKYIDEWFVVGIHPDRYEDNFPIYFSVACSRVTSALDDVEDNRIRKYLHRNRKRTHTPPSPESIIAKLTDQEIIEKTYIIPIRAQREGNLVTITDLEDKRFEKLTEGAIAFVEGLVRNAIREFVPKSHVDVYWWDENGEYFLPAIEPEQKPKEPSSFREEILWATLATKKPENKSKAKPSMIRLEISFFSEAKKVQIKKYKPQRGVIEWGINFNT